MSRNRLLAILALMLGVAMTMATDYRLVIASDDPAVRKAATMTIFEKTGKVSKDDRITSITFSAAADVKPNCLVSLDPASGKAELAVSPDVVVFKGKVMVAGTRPTRKVIPAYLSVDVPVPPAKKGGESVMTPIINQVNNIPWLYIVGGVAVFMGLMFMMNRRSQQFTTSMSKEAKNLYMETVGRITERLERIEVSQDRLVKNPPVVRAFRAQIDEFEARLGRIEKLAKDGNDELVKATTELSQSDRRHVDLVAKLESTRQDATKTQAELKKEADALRAELKLVVKAQDEAVAKLSTLDILQSAAGKSAEADRQLQAQIAGYDEALKRVHQEHAKQLAALHNEMATLRSNQEALLSMPKSLEHVSASISKLPAEFEAIRTSMPNLGGIEAQLHSFEGFGSKLDRIDEVSQKLDSLPEIRNSIESLPERFPRYDESINQVQESLRVQIENLTGRVAESGSHLAELISAHTFAAIPPVTVEEPLAKAQEPKKSKKAKLEVHAEIEAEEPENPIVELAPEPETQSEKSVLAEAEPVAEPEPAQEAQSEPEPEAVVVQPEIEAEITEIEPEAIVEEKDLAPESVPAVTEPHVEESTATPDEPENVTPDAPASEVPVEVATEITEGATVSVEGSTESVVDTPVVAEVIEEVRPEIASSVEAPAAELVPVEVGGRKKDKPEKDGSKAKSLKDVQELSYRYDESEKPAEIKEFHFNNAIKKMTEEEPVKELKGKSQRSDKEAPMTFKLEDLPARLETFEDDEPEAVLPTLKVIDNPTTVDKAGEREAVELVLKSLEPAKSASEVVEAFDHELDDHSSAQMGHWTGFGGSGARTWSSESSRPLQLGQFDGELKPLTPIETAPIGDTIAALTYGFGRVMYSCGSTIHGFWPGRDSRHLTLDHIIPTDDWRLCLKGQNLFVAEEKKVKVLSVQGWFVLEQFAGEYRDQLLSASRWIGLRHSDGAVVDFRDLRGQMAAEGVSLNMEVAGLQFCTSESKVFAGSRLGHVVEVTEHGTETLGQCPEGTELTHLTLLNQEPLAVYGGKGGLFCRHFGSQESTVELGIDSYAAQPVLLGSKLYFANPAGSELVCLDLKNGKVIREKAFEGASDVRKLIGVVHKGHHTLAAITTDKGKKNGRLIILDVKTGREKFLGAVGQAGVNLIAADHHIVFSTSSQYQNVVRVLEPFAQKMAA